MPSDGEPILGSGLNRSESRPGGAHGRLAGGGKRMEDGQRITCGDIAADLISEPSTGTNFDIAATDQIRPIATTRGIPIDARNCISSSSIELGEIGARIFSDAPM